jgi:hypothetical protein
MGSPASDEDVQDVYANFDIPERVLEAVASSVVTRARGNPVSSPARSFSEHYAL